MLVSPTQPTIASAYHRCALQSTEGPLLRSSGRPFGSQGGSAPLTIPSHSESAQPASTSLAGSASASTTRTVRSRLCPTVRVRLSLEPAAPHSPRPAHAGIRIARRRAGALRPSQTTASPASDPKSLCSRTDSAPHRPEASVAECTFSGEIFLGRGCIAEYFGRTCATSRLGSALRPWLLQTDSFVSALRCVLISFVPAGTADTSPHYHDH